MRTESTACELCGAQIVERGIMRGLCPRCVLVSSFGADPNRPAIAVETSRSDWIGFVLDRKYRIEQELGRGGMGCVFLCTHMGTGRHVALKVLTTDFSGNREFQTRFRREARALGRLRHPNIVNITDFGVTSAFGTDVAYIVMEYLDGVTLATFHENRKLIPIRLLLDILSQVAAALDAAHDSGIIHRDLKPENIWLEADGRGGYSARVLDFGIAKTDAGTDSRASEHVDDASSTRTLDAIAAVNGYSFTSPTVAGRTMGTPAYMSPEQCRGQALDRRSDVYSLGVMAYYLISGELPFTGSSGELIQKQIHASPPVLWKKRGGISRSVSDVVMSALEKDPVLRPASATAFVSRLRTAAELEISVMKRARALTAVSPAAVTALLLLHLTITVLPGAVCLLYLSRAPVAKLWMDVLAVAAVIALFCLSSNIVKAGWTAVVLETVESRRGAASLRRALARFASALPRVAFTQLIALTRPHRVLAHSLWPVICIAEKVAGAAALNRAEQLASHGAGALHGVQIRQLVIAIAGATFGLVLLPAISGGAFPDAGFRFFQAFFAFINAVPWSATTLPAYPILYFRSRQMLAETTEPAIGLLESPDFFGNRLRSVSIQSKLSLAAAVVMILGGVYIEQTQGHPAAHVRNERLLRAAELGRISQLNKWLSDGADPNALTGVWTPLTRAVLFGQQDAIDRLLIAGADVNRCHKSVGSALYLAVACRRNDLAKKLLDHGADPNAAPSWGLTPLMVAAMQGNADAVSLLLARGADPSRLSQSHELAADLARQEGHARTVSLLDSAAVTRR